MLRSRRKADSLLRSGVSLIQTLPYGPQLRRPVDAASCSRNGASKDAVRVRPRDDAAQRPS